MREPKQVRITVRFKGRPLDRHKCAGQYVKTGDECYYCLTCGAYCQIPNENQQPEGEQN